MPPKPWKTLSSREAYKTPWTRVEAVPDETEFLEVAIFPFEQVLQMILDNEICDSMTVITVLHAARLRNR